MSVFGVLFSGIAVAFIYHGPPSFFKELNISYQKNFIQEKKIIEKFFFELDRRTDKGYKNALNLLTKNLRNERKKTHQQNSFRDVAIGYFPTYKHKITDIVHVRTIRDIDVFSVVFIAEERYPNLEKIQVINETKDKYTVIADIFDKYFIIPNKDIFIEYLKTRYTNATYFDAPNLVRIAARNKLYVKDYNAIENFSDIRISQYFLHIGVLRNDDTIEGIDCFGRCPREPLIMR